MPCRIRSLDQLPVAHKVLLIESFAQLIDQALNLSSVGGGLADFDRFIFREDRGAAAVFARVVVRLRSDGDVELRAGAVEQDVARRVTADWQIEQLLRLSLRLQITRRVAVANE